MIYFANESHESEWIMTDWFLMIFFCLLSSRTSPAPLGFMQLEPSRSLKGLCCEIGLRVPKWDAENKQEMAAFCDRPFSGVREKKSTGLK